MHPMSDETVAGFQHIKESITTVSIPLLPLGIGAVSPSDQDDFPVLYDHVDQRLGIHFHVRKLPFAQLQAMDARLVTIAPGATNEKHRHAHESIFLVLQGEGVLQRAEEQLPLAQGDVAYVPRWVVHQTRNTSMQSDLRLLAITDFGLTSALMGNYDNTTRLKAAGGEAFQ